MGISNCGNKQIGTLRIFFIHSTRSLLCLEGGVMVISAWVMAGSKNWSAGDGGRQKLIRGQWRAVKIGPRAGPARRVMPFPPSFLRLNGGPFHVIEAESINGFRIPAYF